MTHAYDDLTKLAARRIGSSHREVTESLRCEDRLSAVCYAGSILDAAKDLRLLAIATALDEGHTLQEVADELGISRSGVAQLRASLDEVEVRQHG